MIKRLQLPIGEEYYYLPVNFDDQLRNISSGKLIVNKKVCGCGMTEVYLRNDQPMLMLSPRKELLDCKVHSLLRYYDESSGAVCSRERIFPLHYFERRMVTHGRSMKVEDKMYTINRLHDYLDQLNGRPPKIMTTYDSFMLAKNELESLGILKDCVIPVDEFANTLSDASFKGRVELNMMKTLNGMDNHIVFISATPIPNYILENIPELSNIPYVDLVWPESKLRHVEVIQSHMTSIASEVESIVNKYMKSSQDPTQRYFDVMEINGNRIYSREGVFFINDVSAICNIIQRCDLTPENTLVACANEADNKKKLDALGKGFKIEHIKKEHECNKTFTFVTKHCFEGVDFYSPSSSTFIFANPNALNLNLDMAIDLPQIIGRCRTQQNPFRNRVWFYHKYTDKKTVEAAEQKIMEKKKNTDNLLTRDLTSPIMTAFIKDTQQKVKYSYCYLDVIENNGIETVEANPYAYYSEVRALEIKKDQYKNIDAICFNLRDNHMIPITPFSDGSEPLVKQFFEEFFKDNNFQRRMTVYVAFRENYPQFRSEIVARYGMLKYEDYYEIIVANNYSPRSFICSELEKELQARRSVANISTVFQRQVIIHKPYTTIELKSMLQDIYDSLGVKWIAKATDITNENKGIIKSLPLSINKKRITMPDGSRKEVYVFS